MSSICIIDVGTNSVLSLVAEKSENGNIIEKEQRLKSIGLGRYLNNRGELSTESIDVVVNTINEWKKDAQNSGVDKFKAVGTYVFRKALNGKEMSLLISRSTGIPFEVLTEEQEAFYGFLGATWGKNYGQRILTVDIGGGSTEFVNSVDGVFKDFLSLDLGVVSSTKNFFKEDPPNTNSISDLSKYVFGKLSRLQHGNYNNPDTLICMGGTATTLAALSLGLDKYKGSCINGIILKHAQIVKWQEILSNVNLQKRRQYLKIYPDRADVIVAGAVILNCIMDYLNIDKCTVSDRGLRFGIVLHELLGLTLFGKSVCKGEYR